MSAIHDSTYTELQRRIHAKTIEFIGLRDVFTDSEIITMLSHPDIRGFPEYFVSWLYDTADLIESADD